MFVYLALAFVLGFLTATLMFRWAIRKGRQSK